MTSWNARPATASSSPHRRLSPSPLPSRFSSRSIGHTAISSGESTSIFFRAYDKNSRKWKGTSTLWSASLALDPVITSNQMCSKDAKSAAGGGGGGSRQHSGGPCRHVEVATKNQTWLLRLLFVVVSFFGLIFFLTRTQRGHTLAK